MCITDKRSHPCLHGLPLLRRHGREVGVGGDDHKVFEGEEHVREAVAEHLRAKEEHNSRKVDKILHSAFKYYPNHVNFLLFFFHLSQCVVQPQDLVAAIRHRARRRREGLKPRYHLQESDS